MEKDKSVKEHSQTTENNAQPSLPKKQSHKRKAVKILIIPDECIFNKEETPDAISKSIRLNAGTIKEESSSCETSFISQASFTMENEIPTQWSADLREGLAMLEIDYSDLADTTLPSVYSLYNVLSYPIILLYGYPLFVIKLRMYQLKEELKKRDVYYQESASHDFLIHLLEMDILYRSKRVKPCYDDYAVHRVTPFDIFNEKYGKYTGPMLSALLKEKGIKPPRKVVDRVQIFISHFEKEMQQAYKESFAVIIEKYYKLNGGTEQTSVNAMFHYLLKTYSF